MEEWKEGRKSERETVCYSWAAKIKSQYKSHVSQDQGQTSKFSLQHQIFIMLPCLHLFLSGDTCFIYFLFYHSSWRAGSTPLTRESIYSSVYGLSLTFIWRPRLSNVMLFATHNKSLVLTFLDPCFTWVSALLTGLDRAVPLLCCLSTEIL